jgi:hypothetical protein
MFDGLSLGSYLRLVDYTGRLFREGRAAISAELSGALRGVCLCFLFATGLAGPELLEFSRTAPAVELNVKPQTKDKGTAKPPRVGNTRR